MTINRILITQQYSLPNETVLTASVNIPKNLSHSQLDDLVEEFKQKIIKHGKPSSKVFSNFKNSQDLPLIQSNDDNGSVIIQVSSDSNHYTNEVSSLKAEQLMEALKFIKYLIEKPVNYITYEKSLFLKDKDHEIIFENDKFKIIYTGGSEISDLDKEEFLNLIHKEIANTISFEEFCKKIFNGWHDLTY